VKRTIWVGYDPREQDAFNVAVQSIRAHLSEPIEICAVALPVLHGYGLYQRPTCRRDGKLWDMISDAPMSTEFAISRFFVPLIASSYCQEPSDWALFMDCDMLARADLVELFGLADESKAIQVVQHDYHPAPGTKMDGQVQTDYPRKNWSSVMLWNLRHPANRALTIAKLNTWAGRALHAFKWLDDSHIGALPPCWNHLVGVDEPSDEAKLVHFTLGVPSMDGYATCEHAHEWWKYNAPRVSVEGLRCPATRQ
jgi:lipopolysaccharide biosynthesis glycosyltransferase